MSHTSTEVETVEVETVLQGRLFQAVLFDMDGTLIDSTPAVERSWVQWATEWGIDLSFRDSSHGVPARDIIESLVPADRVDEALARVLHLETTDTHDITVLPGAAFLMDSIPEERKAIVTSCARGLAAARIEASGFPAPRTVVTIDDTAKGKPNPDPFLEGAARLGADPARCLVIEDAPAGLAAARAAGCATIGVAGTHDAGDLVADLVVPSLDRLRVTANADGLVIQLLG